MVLKCFSVFDSKLACFGRPFFELRDESAVRTFADAVNEASPTNMWFRHPEDFSLFVVGEFDQASGVLTPGLPRSLVTASALKREVAAQPGLFDEKLLFRNGESREKEPAQ